MHYIYMLESGWVWRILVIDCEQEYMITPLNFTPFCCVSCIHADGANCTLAGKNVSEAEKEDGKGRKTGVLIWSGWGIYPAC